MADVFDTAMGTLLNPNISFAYNKENPREFSYKDSLNNTYAIRLISKGYKTFELETSWKKDEKIYVIDPPLPDNIEVLDHNKRGNTVAKVFLDEILPQVLKGLTLIINPYDAKRVPFITRFVEKFVDKVKYVVDLNTETGVYTITKKQE